MNYSLIALSVIGSAAAVAADAPPAPAAGEPLYHTAETIPLGSPDRWDYLTWSAASHRLFVAHSSTITVVDTERGTVVGEIPVPGANGVALAPSVGKGYAGSSEKHAVVVFDPASLRVVKHIPVDEDTDGVVYDPASTHVFVMHGDPKEVTAVDTRSDTVAVRIPLGGVPEFAAADGAGKLYVNIKDHGTVERIDTRTLRVDATWPLPGCEKPHGLAVDPASGRLFSGCVNERLLVLDTRDGHLVAQLPIGKGSDAVGFDPKRHRVLSSNGVGTLSVIEQRGPDQYVAMAEVPTQPTARTLAVDAETGRVFLVAGERIETDPAASDPRKRFGIRPGTVQLLVERPVERGASVSKSP